MGFVKKKKRALKIAALSEFVLLCLCVRFRWLDIKLGHERMAEGKLGPGNFN